MYMQNNMQNESDMDQSQQGKEDKQPCGLNPWARLNEGTGVEIRKVNTEARSARVDIIFQQRLVSTRVLLS